jgi:hypothetical protein
MKNFMLKETLNMCLELKKDIEHIRFTLNKINPSKLTININRTDIIIVATN